MGLETFAEAAASAGVDAVLVTDMIVEESKEYRRVLRKHGLQPIFLVAPTSPDERLASIAEVAEGFVYAISRVGITGTQQQVAGDARGLVARLRRYTRLPIALGFGISNAAHVAAVAEFADAAVVGSAIVGLIEGSSREDAPAAVGAFVAALRVAGRGRGEYSFLKNLPVSIRISNIIFYAPIQLHPIRRILAALS